MPTPAAARLLPSFGCCAALLAWGPAAAAQAPARAGADEQRERLLELTKVEPATAAEMALYREFYRYDPQVPLNAEITQSRQSGAVKVLDFRFDSVHDQRATGTLYLPQQGRGGPFPVLVFLHGYGGDRSQADLFRRAFSRYAVLALDAVYHGERRIKGKDIYSGAFYNSRDAIVQTIVDYRRALDWLATREDVDVGRVGLFGVSMGAIMGSVLAGVDERIKATVLIVGGGNWALLGALTEIGPGVALRRQTDLTPDMLAGINHILAPCEPLHWVGQISPRPVLLENGRYDTIVPVPCSQQLFEAAREPKEIHWHPTSHFVLPAALTRSLNLFREQLGEGPSPAQEPAAAPASEPAPPAAPPGGSADQGAAWHGRLARGGAAWHGRLARGGGARLAGRLALPRPRPAPRA